MSIPETPYPWQESYFAAICETDNSLMPGRIYGSHGRTNRQRRLTLGPSLPNLFRDMLPSHFPLFLGGPHARCPEMSSSQNFDGCRNTLDKNAERPVSEAYSLLQL